MDAQVLGQCMVELANYTHAITAGGGGMTTLSLLLGYNYLKNKKNTEDE